MNNQNMNRNSPNADGIPKLRDRIREVTHDTILAAAEAVFAEEGLHAARMETISAKAGVAVGTLYNHFKDRESLLEALLSARHHELLERMDAALEASSKGSFKDRLTALYQSLLEHFYAHRKFLVIFIQAECERTRGKAKLAPTNVMQEVISRAERVVKQGLKEKALRPEDAELFPILCIGVVRGVLFQEIWRSAAEAPVSQRVEQMVTFFLQGAGAKGAQP
jgi:AcrR family transcriptional regulator